MAEWGFQSATELVKALKEKKISSVDLLEYYIDRIGRFDSRTNAVVSTDFDNALKKAEKSDRAIKQKGSIGPLHGLPVTIKDNLEVAGMPCTAGSPDLKKYVSEKNAVLVQSLVNAGAIVFAKTNLPLFADDFQTQNKLFGQTNNPWDLKKTPGGSSGGSAAALAAGLTSLEVGNDIGGSIRHPANFCGVYGHKPSYGIVPDRGRIPPLPGLFPGRYSVKTDIVVNGPLARNAEDLDVALRVISGPESPDRKAWKIQLPKPRKKSIKEFRVGLWLHDPACPVDMRISDRIERVAMALGNAGAKIEEKHPKIDFSRNFDVFISLLNGVMSQTTPQRVFDKWTERSKDDEAGDDYKSKQIRGAVQRHRQWLMMDAERQILRQKWANFFRKFDVLLCPVSPVVAFSHDHSPFFERTIDVNKQERPYTDLMGWVALSSVVYLPSTVAPVGLTSDGLPIGVQIIGPYLEDRTSIHFAKLMSDIVGGFTPPPDFL